MSRLELALLGQPIIQQDGEPVTRLVSQKARALLFYLAVTGQPHSREALAGLLWGDVPEQKARTNLRVALTKLRAVLREYLVVNRRTLSFDDATDFWLDVTEFESSLGTPTPTVGQLQTAVSLYRGPFLADFHVPGAVLFEEWVRPYQERLRQLAMDAMYRLSVYQTEQRSYLAGIEVTGRLLMLEPWMEEAHRQMMLLLALSGQRSAALSQYEKCCAMLDEELGVYPSNATTALYKKILAGEVEEDTEATAVIPTAPSISRTPPFQAPARMAHFVGRTNLLTAVKDGLQDASAASVQAFVGMGGVGKSALAVQIAHAAQSHFKDGVLWANVTASEPMSILESWAQAFGYDFTRIADLDSTAAAFRGIVADKSVLVVLDDATSVSRIRPLLPGGEQCKVLLTTRDHDLARALHARVWLVEELSPENGRLLMTQILGDKRVLAEPEAAAEICAILQNLPLAVEISAQRLKSRPRRKLSDMAQRLRDEKQRLSWLKISDQEVRASFAASWETLDAGLQRVFAILGVFNGRPFTASAIAYIAELDRYLTEDRLFALTALSLIKEEGRAYYRQHPLLADFACEKLGTGREVYGRYAQYYLQFSRKHQNDYDALRPEWSSIMAAIQSAHKHQFWSLVIELTNTLRDAWFTRARYSQARQGYQLANEAALKLEDDTARAQCLLDWGQACIEQNSYDEAEELLIASRGLFHARQMREGTADAQYHLARIALEKNDYDRAERLLAESQQIKKQLHDAVGVASTIYRQARIAYRRGAYERAEALGQAALAAQEKANDNAGALPTLRLLAGIAIAQRNHETARQRCERALAISKEMQDQGELAATLYRLSAVSRRLGELTLAEKYARDSLSLFQRMGDRKTQGLTYYSLSIIKEDMKQFHDALRLGQKSIDLLQETGAFFDLVRAWLHLGDIYLHLEQPEQAQDVWHNALTLAEAQNHPEMNLLLQRLNSLELTMASR